MHLKYANRFGWSEKFRHIVRLQCCCICNLETPIGGVLLLE